VAFIAKLSSALAGLALLGSASLANASLLTNGDFEQDLGLSGSQWGIFGGLDGWGLVSGPGIEVQHNTIVGAFSGDQYVELDSTGNSAMVQMISGLTPGADYTLNFWYRPRTNNGGNDNGIDVYWDESGMSNLVLSLAGFTTGNSSGWLGQELTLTASSDSMYLGFAASGNDNSFGGFVDAVSLSREVPAPATTALFGLGLAALFAGRRRRQQA